MAVFEHLGDLLQAACSGGEEAEESLAGRKDTAEVFGMKLYADEPLVVFQFDDLHALAGFVLANKCHTSRFEFLDQFGVNFVAVTVSLPDPFLFAIQLSETGPFGAGLEQGHSFAESHCAAHFSSIDFGHVNNSGIFALFVEFGAARLIQAAHILSKLNHSELHTKADTKVRNVIGTSPVGTFDHSICATLAETTLSKNDQIKA